MYLKVDYNKRDKEFVTKFYERDTMEDKKSTKKVDPREYLGRYCQMKVALRIDSVFTVGNNTTLQIKAHTVIMCETKRRESEEDVDVLDEM